jgi:hypothetical protein
MAIDAVITAVTRNQDGTADLQLGPRDTPHGKSCPGQSTLTVVNPPPGLEAAVGTEVWGGSDFLMVGDVHWANRVGYTRARLIAPSERQFGTGRAK